MNQHGHAEAPPSPELQAQYLRQDMLWRAVDIVKHSNGSNTFSPLKVADDVLLVAEKLITYVKEGKIDE